MIIRPQALMVDGELIPGLELEVELSDGWPRVLAIGPHSATPEPYVLSAAFVNAHSHLEYRGMQGMFDGLEYWPWIRALTEQKSKESTEEVIAACRLAAEENRRTGVALIAEHSDRPHSVEALRSAGVKGFVLQEVITFFESASPTEKIREVEERLREQGADALTPHSPHLVDPQTLGRWADVTRPLSFHVAESRYERSFWEHRTGPIAEMYKRFEIPFPPQAPSALKALEQLGLLKSEPKTLRQIVHACDVTPEEIDLIAQSGMSVAHCPRSNENLGCPIAPIRSMLQKSVPVGLGMDSAASSGPIDMFAEMRAALTSSLNRGQALSGAEVWRMATTMGAATLGQNFALKAGNHVPLIKIHAPHASSAEELIEAATPQDVEWIQ